MRCDAEFLNYLRSCYTEIEIFDILNNNALFHSRFAKSFKKDDFAGRESIFFNQMLNSLNMSVVRQIFPELQKKGINYIAFKGLILSQMLYLDPKKRTWGDIDFFVDSCFFEEAYTYLNKKGFKLVYPNGYSNPHHIVLKRGKNSIELHKNIFHPAIGIDENFLRKNTIPYVIDKDIKVTTFNTTATILHLIYHLYMDTYLTSVNLYSIFTSRKLPKAHRFLYRVYEISLFSEKYFNEIKWEDIERDVKSQKLRIIFKKMIFDILRIFPSVFPKSFVDTVRKIDYVEDERDKLYKYLIDIDINNCNDFDALISKFIDDNWDARRKKNICEKVGETILLAKKSLGEKQELNCVIDTEKTKKGLKIVFKVSNDDFYISEMGNYDTQTSDGVHLLLCGTEQYSYNSIFFFPKQNDGEIRVVVCDVLNNRNIVLSDNLIKAEFSKTEMDYTITAILSNEFLKKNNLNSYLYMGLVISDCSSETHRRKNQLILSEDDSQWYNPTYFAKIIIK